MLAQPTVAQDRPCGNRGPVPARLRGPSPTCATLQNRQHPAQDRLPLHPLQRAATLRLPAGTALTHLHREGRTQPRHHKRHDGQHIGAQGKGGAVPLGQQAERPLGEGQAGSRAMTSCSAQGGRCPAMRALVHLSGTKNHGASGHATRRTHCMPQSLPRVPTQPLSACTLTSMLAVPCESNVRVMRLVRSHISSAAVGEGT